MHLALDLPSLDEPEPVRDQLAAIADQPWIMNPLQAVHWEMRDGKVVQIFAGIVLAPEPWEAQWQSRIIIRQPQKRH
jgi:hypothetical protein